MEQVTVIGGGSWATALTKCLADNGHQVCWWMRDEEQVAHIAKHGHNPKYLSQIELSADLVTPTTELAKALATSEIIILAIPAAFLLNVLEQVTHRQVIDKTLVSAVKGIIPGSNEVVGAHLRARYSLPTDRIAVICGPCHAEEVAMEKLSYLTIACSDKNRGKGIATLLTNRYIRTTISNDVLGVEYGAVLKNIMAVAAGIYHGLGYGDNFHAVLISRAIQEMEQFLDVIVPHERDVNNPAYLGDLLVTAYSQFSRNRMFGTYLGKGYSVRSAQLEMNMVAEGFYAVAGVYEMAKQHRLSLPICASVYRVCYEKIAPGIEMRLLADSLA